MSEEPTPPGAEPVPLPPSRVPDGAAAWRLPEVRRWLATVPSRWAHPGWALLVLVGVVVWAVLAMPEPPRPDFSLFGSAAVEYHGSYEPMRAGGLPGLTDTFGAVGPSGGPPIASDTARLYVTSYAVMAGPASWWGWPTVFLGLLLLELYWIWRRPALALALLVPLTAAGLLFEDGLGDAVPAARIAVGAGAALVGVALLHRRAVRVRRWEQVAEAAGPERQVPPTVPGRGRRPYVLLAAGAALLVAAAFAGGPAAAAGDNTAMLVTGVPALALVVEGVAALLRSARLRHPQPVLRVLVREGADGKTWLYAADDRAGSEPLLGFRAWGAYEGGEAGRGAEPGALREAVLYGTPDAGAELAYVAAVDGADGSDGVDGRVAVERGTAPMALTAPAGRSSRRTKNRAENRTKKNENGIPLSDLTSNDRDTAISWSAGPVSRAMGVFLLLVEIGVVGAFLDGDRGWRVWFALVLLPFSLSYIAAALNWRITADRSGVWIAGGWRVKRLLWAEIEKVEYDDESIRFRGPEGVRSGVRPTGWARLDRRTAKGHVAGRAAEGIRAMLADPELRPVEDSTPAEQGMPLGPVIVVLAVVVAVVVGMLG
ncbi:hypothetical protein [Streptomyces sp. NPDC051561]|uniref:hypothetical protein n=1 Tax=Streptomyces sp. NPDC051561 TaxID=3365658 RepID=UPI0037A61905